MNWYKIAQINNLQEIERQLNTYGEKHTHSDPQSMMELFYQEKLPIGYHEGGDGYIYYNDGQQVKIIPNLRANYFAPENKNKWTIKEKNVPTDIKDVVIYHGTSSPGANINNLNLNYNSKNFPSIGNRFKGLYFTSIKEEAEEYSTMDGVKPSSQVIEAKIDKNAKVINEKDFTQKHQNDDWNQSAQQYDVIYRMDAAGEFPEVVIINPKVLIPINENINELV